MKTQMRLARAIALAGIASRRKAEILIQDGEVKVNGQYITKAATNVDPSKDEIIVGNQRIRPEQKIYLILNKPRGVVSTVKDTHNRKTVLDLVPKKWKHRLYPVGRLDRESTGLILMTNDGDMAFRLIHPRFQVVKKYRAKLNRALQEKDRLRLEQGVYIEGGRTAPCRIRSASGSTNAEVEIYEGRKHQIRLMFYRQKYDVKRLERIQLGPLTLKGLSPGHIRTLTDDEIAELKKSVALQ